MITKEMLTNKLQELDESFNEFDGSPEHLNYAIVTLEIQKDFINEILKTGEYENPDFIFTIFNKLQERIGLGKPNKTQLIYEMYKYQILEGLLFNLYDEFSEKDEDE